LLDPCKACTNYGEVKREHRTFIKCTNEEAHKGFHYDNYWYRHTCDNHTPKDECLGCKKYKKPYCTSVYADCKDEEGK
jgi:hypothetical protein